MDIKNSLIITGVFTVSILLGFLFLDDAVSQEEIEVDETAEVYDSGLDGRYYDYITPNQSMIDVLHYDISIELYSDEEYIDGYVIVRGRITDDALERIDLNFYDNMEIEQFVYNGREAAYIQDDMRLSVYRGTEKSDTFRIEVKYTGTPEKTGLASFDFGEINGQDLIYTLTAPVFSSTWFPCNDKPDDKALLDIRIKADSSLVSVSNGVLVNVETEADKREYHWKSDYPISTYLICFYSSDYVHFADTYTGLDGTEMPIDYYVLPESLEKARKDFRVHNKLMSFMVEMFGEYPFIEEKYGVAEFLWNYGAMEHQTITGLGHSFIGGMGLFTDLLLHELAHSWFGNAVGPKTWKDVWLNEGFAEYCEALYDEKMYGQKSLQDKMRSLYAEDFGRLYNPSYADIYGPTVYDKGAWTLHMLRSEIGDTLFFNGMRNYYEKYKYKNASTSDFQNVMEDISGRELKKFFDQWVYEGEGIPVIEGTWSSRETADGYLLEIETEQVQDGFGVYEFTLDMEIDFRWYRSNGRETVRISKRKQRFSFNLNKEPESIIFDPDNWLLAEINIKNGNK